MKRLSVIISGLIISVASASIMLIYYKEYVIGAIIFCCVIYFIAKIFNLFSRSDRDLGIILEAVRNGDTTLSFNNAFYPGKIGEKLNEISETLHYTRLAIVRNQTYFSYLLDQVPSGVFVADFAGKIYTFNTALLNIFGLPAIGSISRISEIYPQAADILANLGNEDKASINISDKNYSVSCSKIQLPDRGELYIYVLTDIDIDLNRKEIESWTMSVRTLSHEIMNTVAPIISISKTLSCLDNSQNSIPEMTEGLTTISAIGEELMQFAKNYRAFAHTPEPVLQKENLKEIVDEISAGFKYLPGIGNINVLISNKWYPVRCDRSLTYTAISNVFKNSIEAIQRNEAGTVIIDCSLEKNGYVRLDISNNGETIPEDISKEIFSPFFTTKSDGQGIGLPLSKRIMVSQGGNLFLSHRNQAKTTFSFIFLPG